MNDTEKTRRKENEDLLRRMHNGESIVYGEIVGAPRIYPKIKKIDKPLEITPPEKREGL